MPGFPAGTIYDDELGYIVLDPTVAGGIRVLAPPGPPPPTLPRPPAGAPAAPAPQPPGVEERPVEVDDDYTADLEVSRWPSVDDQEAERAELEQLELEEEQDGRFLAAVDPRIRFGGGVDAHLSRALGCAACRFQGPRDMRGAGRACALRCWQSNNAVDVMAPVGFAVRTIRDGTVSTRLGYGLLSSAGGTAGYRLHVEHAGGLISWYQHLGPRIAARGRRVHQGDVIGFVGRWPDFPSHVHFAVNPPFNPERFWELVVSRTGRERAPPPTPPAPIPPLPEPISPAQRRTVQKAWLNLMDALGADRRDARRELDEARAAIRKALR